jgi:hypothetical protein
VPTDEEFLKDVTPFYERNYQLLEDMRKRYDRDSCDIFSIENMPFSEIQKCILETLAFMPKPC